MGHSEAQLQRASLSAAAPGKSCASAPAWHVSTEVADLELACFLPSQSTGTSSAKNGQNHRTQEESSCVHSLGRTHRHRIVIHRSTVFK